MIPEHLLQPCDIVLVSGKGIISGIIKWCTNSKWSHVALYVGGEGRAVIEAMENGVCKDPVGSMNKGHTDYCILRYANLTAEQKRLILAKAETLIYEAYDKGQLGTLGIYSLFRKIGLKWAAFVSNSRTKMICSEVVAVAYSTAMIIFNKNTKMVTPESLYKEDYLMHVSEGKI